MKEKKQLEAENTVGHHFVIVGSSFSKVIKKLDKALNYYRLSFDKKIKGFEIIYDVPSNLLCNAGLILSKQYTGDKIYFKLRKISNLPNGYKRPSQKFIVGESKASEEPKDFPLQIATAISNSFSSRFTIDLVSVVRQTVPKIQIEVKADKYSIIGGTGYRAVIMFEIANYKDLETNKIVKRPGVTVVLPKDDKFDKENKIILNAIDRSCKELVGYKESRFEIANRLLHPQKLNIETNDDSSDDNSEK